MTRTLSDLVLPFWRVVRRTLTQWRFLQQHHPTGTRPDPAERSPTEEHSVGARRGGLHWTRHQAHAGRTCLIVLWICCSTYWRGRSGDSLWREPASSPRTFSHNFVVTRCPEFHPASAEAVQCGAHHQLSDPGVVWLPAGHLAGLLHRPDHLEVPVRQWRLVHGPQL